MLLHATMTFGLPSQLTAGFPQFLLFLRDRRIILKVAVFLADRSGNIGFFLHHRLIDISKLENPLTGVFPLDEILFFDIETDFRA